jgi:hypothetical protein
MAGDSGPFTLVPRLAVQASFFVMDSNDLALERLSRGECMRLMASVPVGRIVYTRQALPAVEVVNFALADGDIVMRVDFGGKLAAATREAVVAFEADSVDVARQTGWSVTVIGQCQAVTDDGELRQLGRIGPRSWAPGKRDHFIKITPVIVTGRRLGARHILAAGDACHH